jgi:hypothetical protein
MSRVNESSFCSGRGHSKPPPASKLERCYSPFALLEVSIELVFEIEDLLCTVVALINNLQG